MKLTIDAVVGTTVDQIVFMLIKMRDYQNYAPPPNMPIVVPKFAEAGSSNKRRSRSVYTKTPKRTKYLL